MLRLRRCRRSVKLIQLLVDLRLLATIDQYFYHTLYKHYAYVYYLLTFYNILTSGGL